MDPGVRLGTYLEKSPRTGIALWCVAGTGRDQCLFVQKFEMADVIRRLDERGIDDKNVGIRELPRYLRRPCPRCGRMEFEARPDFQPVPMGLGRSMLLERLEKHDLGSVLEHEEGCMVPGQGIEP